MKWSPQQADAIDRVQAWWKDPNKKQILNFQGVAGTGKTTIARHFAEGVSGAVYFVCYTGKAAHVLRKKGCPDATTIHKLLYLPKDRSRNRLRTLESELLALPDDASEEIIRRLRKAIDEEKERLSRPAFSLNEESRAKFASLIIVDECSMVGNKIGADLVSLGVPIIALGDPAQLPPVKDTGFFSGEPDILLTEIHRQAEDSPILHLATLARKGKPLPIADYGHGCAVIPRVAMGQDLALAADQILVGRNTTRRTINKRMRDLRGLQDTIPEPGDKIVCLQNDHERGLLNGSLWQVSDILPVDDDLATLTIDPLDDDDAFSMGLDCHLHFFQGRENTLPYYERKEAGQFDYGYALTAHKAQGSQWDDVLIFDESKVFRADARKWLYTAITRAAEKVTIVV